MKVNTLEFWLTFGTIKPMLIDKYLYGFGHDINCLLLHNLFKTESTWSKQLGRSPESLRPKLGHKMVPLVTNVF